MYKSLFFVLILSLFSCSNNELTLYGNIENRPSSRFELEQRGRKFSGVYYPNIHQENTREVNGSLKDNTLTLKEYNDDNEHVGFFRGILNDSTYTGEWISIHESKKISFHFTTHPIATDDKNLSTEINEDTISLEEKIKTAYQMWVNKKTGFGEYWTEENFIQRAEENRINGVQWGVDSEEETGDCKPAIPSEMEVPYYFDMNNDQIKDALIPVHILYCDPGNWSSTMPPKQLFVISISDGYTILEDPEQIKFGGVFKEFNEDNELVYEYFEYAEGDGRCCPSIRWNIHYKYIDNNFKIVKKTEKVSTN